MEAGVKGTQRSISLTIERPTDDNTEVTEPSVNVMHTPTAAQFEADFEHAIADHENSSSLTYAYEVLKSSTPVGVDAAHKERHLSRSDFERLFNMCPEEFMSMPKEEQQRRKTALGLF